MQGKFIKKTMTSGKRSSNGTSLVIPRDENRNWLIIKIQIKEDVEAKTMSKCQ